MKISTFPSYPSFQGETDGVVIDTLPAMIFMDQYSGQLALIPGVASDEQMALVFPPGSELVKIFNNALQAMAADGTLEAINNRWFFP